MRAAPRAITSAGVAVLVVACSGRFGGPKPPDQPPTAGQMAELWTEPGDIGARDLFHGPGGAALQPPPGARFHFLAEDTTGFSGGYDLRDDSGLEWSAKFGPEAQSEVVTSRIVWAIGYHQPATYYVADWRLHGSAKPAHPSRFRPKLPGQRKVDEWAWRENPFVGTRPYRGLLVLMRIVSNWDLLDRNNALYELDAPPLGPRRWYVVRDLGASLGKATLGPTSGTRNDLEDFLEQGFIDGVNAHGEVSFDGKGRFHRALFRGITVADVRWTCERLARITDHQWSNAFRAAGYDEARAAGFIGRIKEKIAAGLALRSPM